MIEQHFKNFDRVTLYRLLNSFEEKGLIHKVFDANGDIFYAKCQVCKDHNHQDDHIRRWYNIDNMLRYRYGMTLRIAFNKFAIHGFYSLTPLFVKEKGDQLYPISVGVSWIRF